MTHDELLARLWVLPEDVTELDHGAKAVQALREVVELHKPKEFEFNDQPVLVCGHCQLGVVGDEYPCETIQVIEKELG
jgi:hypothetical protein